MPAQQPTSRLKFAANLSWLYTDLPFMARFGAAAADGFAGVECLFPHEHDTSALRTQLQTHGLTLVLFNAEPGDWAGGDRGLACLPGREQDFRRSVLEALERATTLSCPRIHVMAGLCPPGDEAAAWALYTERLAWAAHEAQRAGLVLTIEPINPRDMPGYLLTHQAQAHDLVARIASPALRVQMDLYHCQIVEGDVSMRLRQWLPTGQVAHLQIAAVPDRGEPDRGELSYPWLFDELSRLGWTGWIGCEYRPRGASTSAGLSWLAPYRSTPR
ncbi:2-oxo-tetronate isomerase [Aquabacterium sp. A3]|uniref:2-oxo-tetronate isomerase n=1 Tax=Aquabacterium sp. A3 TaxID=3132829 RepID=UPI003119323C